MYVPLELCLIISLNNLELHILLQIYCSSNIQYYLKKSHLVTQIFAILHHFCKPLIVRPRQLHNNTISLHHIYPNFSTQNSLKITRNENKRRFVNIKVSNLRLLLLWRRVINISVSCVFVNNLKFL